MLIQPAPKNSAAVYRALVEFGAPNIATLTPASFTEAGTFYRMGVPPVAVDILAEIKGAAFSVAWKNRVAVAIDAGTGLTAHFISRDDLIAAKLAAGRPRDLADVDELRKAVEAAKVSASKPPKPPKFRKQRKKKT